jgi:hypothetical protein
MAEFGISKTCVHNYIEEQRVLLRIGTADLAARDREQALALLDNAIERLIPHINGDITIQTEIAGKKGPVIISIEEWQARIQACGALVKLIDGKSKLLGMDAAVRTEPPPSVPPESEEQRARARLGCRCRCPPRRRPQCPRPFRPAAVIEELNEDDEGPWKERPHDDLSVKKFGAVLSRSVSPGIVFLAPVAQEYDLRKLDASSDAS